MDMQQIIECVPNFSEGRDMNLIKQITDEIEAVEGVRLLNVDPGKATNRTVVTFVGNPQAAVEAAFRAIKKAGDLIDMSKHKGEHPRMGATDVCPLIPIANITMGETVEWAQRLAERVGRELSLPVYLYEEAQADKTRSNLSIIRAGEYEGFFKKINEFTWPYDGWGMTNDGKNIILGTGGSVLYFVDPENFKILNQISVTDNYGPVSMVNELEYVNNFIYANVYETDNIVKIDPQTGAVVGKLNLSGLLQKSGMQYNPQNYTVNSGNVLNGIAYDSAKNSFYVTGKMWPALFEIKINN